MSWETWGILLDHIVTHAPSSRHARWWVGRYCHIVKRKNIQGLIEDTPTKIRRFLAWGMT